MPRNRLLIAALISAAVLAGCSSQASVQDDHRILIEFDQPHKLRAR